MQFEEFSKIVSVISQSNESQKIIRLIDLFNKLDSNSISTAICLLQGRFGTRTYSIYRDHQWPDRNEIYRILSNIEYTKNDQLSVNQVFNKLSKIIILSDKCFLKHNYVLILKELG